jgi:hypothetical protein
LEFIRKYKDLLRALKHQQLDHWLLDWEKVYAEAARLKLPNFQGHRCLYDFLTASRTVDVTFVADREAILNYEIQQEETPSSIMDLLEEFRNQLRTAWALINKGTSHSAFATLQGLFVFLFNSYHAPTSRGAMRGLSTVVVQATCFTMYG